MLDEDDTPQVEVDSAPEGDATPEIDTTASPWGGTVEKYPEYSRAHVLDALKHAEGLTTKKFQEAAELRKRVEPFEPYMGIEQLTQFQPEELTEGLQFLQLIQDEEQGPDIVRRLAEHYGIALADVDGEEDWDDGAPEDGDEPDLAELVKQHVQESTAPLTQYMQQQQQQAEEAAATKQVEESFAAIQKEAGREFDEEEKNALFQLAQGFIGKSDDPLAAGWGVYKQITGRAQKGIVAQKRREPGQAEVGSSRPDGAAQPSTSIEDARAEVMAKYRAMTEA